ncbi:MAG: DNA-protecting protein DprA [Intestinibacter sp.]|uniref:DNA-processing protein DprA n=1 Tax=Intestinibacter sp. TaxID=1965304 RepID=UPI0025BF0ADE|nr:DNA-processing protein DprA [Intestinibacter sp.]MCI6738961.1 DNA-protecting protein DprA [Intestinibacter sp.]
MDNSIILTIINLVGKNKTNDIIDRGFLDQTINLNEEDILSCLKKYKEIDTEFDIPSLEEVKISIEDSVKVLLESEKLGIKATNIFNEDFPSKLKDIKDRSILIFYRGDLSCLYEKNSIAIIGTRTPTEKGQQIGEALGYFYAKEGFVIVSGLANGCDTAGHIGCLKANGKTVATLPCGLDKCYPNDNNDLADEIVKNGGCLISEYKIGINPSSENFIERDRLQAALSLGVLVVECAVECGTMHTVGFAESYNKKIAVSLHKDVEEDIDTVKGNLYLLENKKAIGLKDINDYRRYKNILLGYKIYC